MYCLVSIIFQKFSEGFNAVVKFIIIISRFLMHTITKKNHLRTKGDQIFIRKRCLIPPRTQDGRRRCVCREKRINIWHIGSTSASQWIVCLARKKGIFVKIVCF